MKILFLYSIALLLLQACGQQTTPATDTTVSPQEEPLSAYLFAYFTGNEQGEEAIHFAISHNGYRYHALHGNQPVLNSAQLSTTGGLRDPHILRGADGKTFYMVATDMQVATGGWGANYGMVLLTSNDLLHWRSSVVNIPESFPEFADVNRVWAPQSIYDPETEKYMVYWSMRAGEDTEQIYYAYANADFSGLETTPKQLFFHPENSSSIDADIIYHGGKYHLFLKTDEAQAAGIKKAVSDKLTSGYSLQDKFLDQTEEAVEGSGIFKLNDSDTWILMYDVYKNRKYQFTESRDLENFRAIDDAVSMDFHPRHGTVLPITAKEAEALQRKWGKLSDPKSSDNR